MTFIITLIALVIERFFHWHHLRHWRWFSQYQQRLSGTRLANWSSFLLLLLCILPFIVLVGFINHLLEGWMYGALKLIFGVIILVYCMGPTNLWLDTFGCIGEFHAEEPKRAIDKAQSTFHINNPNNSQNFHSALTNAIFIEANHRVFAVVFWFVLLGPVGAVLYRLISLCAQDTRLGLNGVAYKFLQWLDFLPIRLLTFIFALGGHFTEVITLWKKDAIKGVAANNKLLTECGVAALDMSENNLLPEDGATEKAALELFDRSLVIGLVFLAVIVLLIIR